MDTTKQVMPQETERKCAASDGLSEHKKKVDIARSFVTKAVVPISKYNYQSVLVEFPAHCQIYFKYSVRRGLRPGFSVSITSRRNKSAKEEFARALKEIHCPAGFGLNSEQQIAGSPQGIIVLFCKRGVDNLDQAYADIVEPGKGLGQWRDMFNSLVECIVELTKVNPRYEGELSSNELTSGISDAFGGTGDRSLMEQAMENEKFKEYIQVLDEKRQIVLTGAPGTGKTYLARKLAEAIAGEKFDSGNLNKDGSRIAMCQFHPTFDYSDFVEGLRPCKDEKTGTLGFERRDGIFMAFCREALKQPRENFVFIIDEINRGDLSKIFGELFFAIEKDYRGKSGLKTRYNNLMDDNDDFKKGFSVPENVYIIGTMNDVDRGVESIDFAIRRRFGWIEVTPEDRVDEVLSDVKKKNSDLFETTKTVMDNLNSAIRDERYGLGSAYCIGPSYFKDISSDKDFDVLWTRAIEPLLRECLRGMNDVDAKVKEFKAAYDKNKAVKQDGGQQGESGGVAADNKQSPDAQTTTTAQNS